MSKTLLTARWVVGYEDGEHVLHENACVIIEHDQIIHVGELPDSELVPIEYGQAILSPGFIDLDALSDLDTTILGYDHSPAWRKGRVWPESYIENGPYEMYTTDELAFQKRFSFTELIRNGITTALPIASLFYREWGETIAEFEAAADEAEMLGLRVYLGPAYRTGGQVTDQAGFISAIYDEPRGLQGLEYAREFAEQMDGRAAGLIRAMFAPDRIETCTPTLLQRTASIAREMNLPVRQHCLQSDVELQLVREQHNCSPIEFLLANNALQANWLLPHGSKATHSDFELIKDAGATIVHCPLVSGRHGGIFRSLPRCIDMGINVGMGTDTWPADMIMNMQMGMIAARMAEGHTAITSKVLFNAATLGGAQALGRNDLGRLSPRSKADIAVIDLSNTLQTPDPIQTLMTSCSGKDVRDVWINGRRVMQDRKLPSVDEASDRTRAQTQYDGLVAKYPDRTLGHPPLSEIFPSTYRRVSYD